MVDVPENSVQPADRAEWRRWLSEHHAQGEGVWLVYHKKRSGKPRLAYEEVIEEALCFGWIDGKARSLGAEQAMIWISPRRPGSVWSRSNQERVARLTEAGLMAEPGLAKVEAAKRDGSWYRIDAIESVEMPPDLAEAMAADEAASRNFAAFPATLRQAQLWWVTSAKRAETRAARVARVVQAAHDNSRNP